MNGFLLDTNVISELMKPHPDPKAEAWIAACDETSLFLSVLTLGELRRGIEMLGANPKRDRLEAWLERELPLRFFGRILAIDDYVADRWGRIAGQAAARGRSLPVIDGLLAATALHFDLTLVTRDVSGVAASGVSFLNPWA